MSSPRFKTQHRDLLGNLRLDSMIADRAGRGRIKSRRFLHQSVIGNGSSVDINGALLLRRFPCVFPERPCQR